MLRYNGRTSLNFFEVTVDLRKGHELSVKYLIKARKRNAPIKRYFKIIGIFNEKSHKFTPFLIYLFYVHFATKISHKILPLYIPINPVMKKKSFDPYVFHNQRSYDLSSRGQFTKNFFLQFSVIFLKSENRNAF
jgi:hypothetical protein